MLSSNRILKISAVVSLLLAGFFLTVLLRDEPKLSSPLVNMNIEEEAKRNAVHVHENSSPIITGIIDKNITKGTYILRGQVIIPKSATVTILPETIIYAERDASIEVEGELNAKKTTWLSNQIHPSKQYWYGLVAKNGGAISLSESNISNATAAITADSNGKVVIKKADLQNNVAGLVIMLNSDATITDSKIENGTVGIQIIGGSPIIKNITLKSLYDGLRIFHQATPDISDISLAFISHEIVHYLAEPDLTINHLTFTPADGIAKLIYDGKNQSTHKFNGQEYKTGLVRIENIFSATTAIDKVRSLTDVKKWLSLFSSSNNTNSATGGIPIIEITSESNGLYTIHVYEKTSDHNVTFNWYTVDLKINKVSPEFHS